MYCAQIKQRLRMQQESTRRRQEKLMRRRMARPELEAPATPGPATPGPPTPSMGNPGTPNANVASKGGQMQGSRYFYFFCVKLVILRKFLKASNRKFYKSVKFFLIFGFCAKFCVANLASIRTTEKWVSKATRCSSKCIRIRRVRS